MKEETKAKLTEWAAKLGVPVEDTIKQFNEAVASFKKTITAKDEDWYEQAALRKVYVEIKAQLTSRAKPFDYIALGCSGAMDVTRKERETKLADYNNPETKQKTLDEGRVIVIEGIPTPIDTREWMIKPDPSKGEKGFKNRNCGKPLVESMIRTLVLYGRPSKGGDMKLISVMENGELTKLIPPMLGSFRTRFNLRSDDPGRYSCNASRVMKFDPISLPEFPQVTPKVVCDILTTAPEFHPETKPTGLRAPLKLLRMWHDLHAEDKRRLVIIVGSVTRINREPTSVGSYLVVIEDASAMDFAAEGVPIWVPPELKSQLDFAQTSQIVAIGRTNIGPGFNKDTGQLDSTIERVQVNANAIFALPEYRVPPDEEDVFAEATEVQ